MASWEELEAAAPPIAELGGQRLAASRVALLGTLREDGSPRISAVEPYLGQGQLLFGAMSWSHKSRDLLRDSRCVLHTAVTSPDAGEPELKLYGRALEAPADIRAGCPEGWWHAQPPGAAVVFAYVIEQATLIEWDMERSRVFVRRWSAKRGLTQTSRSYP